MVKKVMNYVTDDGQHFDNVEEANLHEIAIKIIHKQAQDEKSDQSYETLANRLRGQLLVGIRCGLLKYVDIVGNNPKETFMNK